MQWLHGKQQQQQEGQKKLLLMIVSTTHQKIFPTILTEINEPNNLPTKGIY